MLASRQKTSLTLLEHQGYTRGVGLVSVSYSWSIICWKIVGRAWVDLPPCWLLFHFLILFFFTFSLFATDGFTQFIVSVKGTWWWHADYLMQSRCDGQRTTHIQASALCVFTVLCPPTLNIEIKIIMPSWKISQFLKHIWRREEWGERSFAGRAIIEDEQVHALQNCSTHDVDRSVLGCTNQCDKRTLQVTCFYLFCFFSNLLCFTNCVLLKYKSVHLFHVVL